MDPFNEHPDGRRFISTLGENTPVKHLLYCRWGRWMRPTPKEYDTTANLMVIGNHPPTDGRNASRSILLHWDPEVSVVHRMAAEFFWDQEIHDWFGENLAFLSPLEHRFYVQTSQVKDSRRDWKRFATEAFCAAPLDSLVQSVERDAAYGTRSRKLSRYLNLAKDQGLTGASQASYYRRLKNLRADGRLNLAPIPSIPVRGRRRPTPTIAELEALELADQQRPAPAPEPVPEPPLNVPQDNRANFSEPVRGNRPPQARGPASDDTVAFEPPPNPDAEDEADAQVPAPLPGAEQRAAHRPLLRSLLC
jgi:hypothetical protein